MALQTAIPKKNLSYAESIALIQQSNINAGISDNNTITIAKPSTGLNYTPIPTVPKTEVSAADLMSRIKNVQKTSIWQEGQGYTPIPTTTSATYAQSQQLPVSSLQTPAIPTSMGGGGGKAYDEAMMSTKDYFTDAKAQNKAASYLNVASAGLGFVGSIYDYQSVKKSKGQYEANKKILDTNFANAQANIYDELRENSADYDIAMSAKNVDLSSQAIEATKTKAGIEAGKDIAEMGIQNELQKSAIDLQYKMAKSAAKKNMISSFANLGLTAAMLFI